MAVVEGTRRTESRRMVECALCGISYDASARTFRDIQAGRVEARCVLHRKRNPRRATVTAAARRFWLERFTIAEIVEIAEEMISFLPPSARTYEPRALVASAAPRINVRGDVDGEDYGTDLNR